jgi:exopolyphosphatase/guanosine-5'-triphosphate,3'-diphosphate pyrophosphatase
MASELVAVVDLGSTAARFTLARIKPGRGFKVVLRDRVETRLGDGPPDSLPREGVRDTVKAVRRFLRRVRRDGARPRVLAVATAAVREARNRDRLLRPLREEDGVAVQVLSAGQEARLGALAVLDSLAVRDVLVADLGGASLQLTRIRKGRIVSTAGLPLGVLRTTRAFLRHDPPQPRELMALRREVRRQLLEALPAARRSEIMVGLGGTVRTLASVHLRLQHKKRKERHGLRLHQSDVTEVRERLEAVGTRKRRKILGTKAERADIILAGAIVIEELMTLGGYLKLVICTRGVRDGLLLRETFDGEG